MGSSIKSNYDINDNDGPDLRNVDYSISSFEHRIISSNSSSSVKHKNTEINELKYDASEKYFHKNHILKDINVIINEVGSIHLSFTCSEGAELFVIWSGCHANIPMDMLPPESVVPKLPPEGFLIYTIIELSSIFVF